MPGLKRAEKPSPAEQSELEVADRRLEELRAYLRKRPTMSDELATIWGFVWRRGYSEAVEKGMLSINSPSVLTEKAKLVFKAHPDLAQGLWDYYKNTGYRLSEIDLFVALEEQFGDQIVQSICIPMGLHSGGCLVSATYFCRENPRGENAKPG